MGPSSDGTSSGSDMDLASDTDDNDSLYLEPQEPLTRLVDGGPLQKPYMNPFYPDVGALESVKMDVDADRSAFQPVGPSLTTNPASLLDEESVIPQAGDGVGGLHRVDESAASRTMGVDKAIIKKTAGALKSRKGVSEDLKAKRDIGDYTRNSVRSGETRWSFVSPPKPAPSITTTTSSTSPKPRIWASSREELVSILPEMSKSVHGISWKASEAPMLLIDEGVFDSIAVDANGIMSLTTSRDFTCLWSDVGLDSQSGLSSALQKADAKSVQGGLGNAAVDSRASSFPSSTPLRQLWVDSPGAHHTLPPRTSLNSGVSFVFETPSQGVVPISEPPVASTSRDAERDSNILLNGGSNPTYWNPPQFWPPPPNIRGSFLPGDGSTSMNLAVRSSSLSQSVTSSGIGRVLDSHGSNRWNTPFNSETHSESFNVPTAVPVKPVELSNGVASSNSNASYSSSVDVNMDYDMFSPPTTSMKPFSQISRLLETDPLVFGRSDTRLSFVQSSLISKQGVDAVAGSETTTVKSEVLASALRPPPAPPLALSLATKFKEYIPPNIPPEIYALVDAYIKSNPVIAIASRTSANLHLGLDQSLTDEFVFVYLGYFQIIQVLEERIPLLKMSKTKESPEFQGRVRWRLQFKWTAGGEYFLPDGTQPVTSRPWWRRPELVDTEESGHGVVDGDDESDQESTPRYQTQRRRHENYSSRYTFIKKTYSILPSHLLGPRGSGASDNAFPRGWHCSVCGKLNEEVYMRHRICNSSFCEGNGPSDGGYALSLGTIRNPWDNIAVLLPSNSYPEGIQTSITKWNDSMRTFSYVVRRNDEINLKHIFTGNKLTLQKEPTQLLRDLQLHVRLKREPGVIGSYFSYFAGGGHGSSLAAVAWQDVPACVSQVRDFLMHRARYHGECGEAFKINSVAILGWVTSGSKRGSETLKAKESSSAVLCLGSEVILNVSPKAGISGKASGRLRSRNEVEDDVMVGLDDESEDENDELGFAEMLVDSTSSVRKKRSKASKRVKTTKLVAEAVTITLIHGDILVLSGDDFEYSLKRTGTSILVIGSYIPEVDVRPTVINSSGETKPSVRHKKTDKGKKR